MAITHIWKVHLLDHFGVIHLFVIIVRVWLCWFPWQNHIYKIGWITSMIINWREVSFQLGYYPLSWIRLTKFSSASGAGASTGSTILHLNYCQTQVWHCSNYGFQEIFPVRRFIRPMPTTSGGKFLWELDINILDQFLILDKNDLIYKQSR